MSKNYALKVFHCIFTLFFCVGAYAADKPLYIAIIMDDMGSSAVRGERLIRLPGQLTYSFLPYTPYAVPLARDAHVLGKEVMLHLPMEPMGNENMGPGGILSTMSRQQLRMAVRNALMAVPYVVGVNNHMGSLLTRSNKSMYWLMQELKTYDNLYFVDSRTHYATVAAQMAIRSHVKHVSRDVFLDHVVDKNTIDLQFKRLISKAKSSGFALAIGHPHILTIQALESWLSIIAESGIELVRVSDYIQLLNKAEGAKNLWQASLSLSHKAVKN